jgi:hypothetical protein
MDDIWKNAVRKAHTRDKHTATNLIANNISTTTTTTSLAVTNKNPATSSALTEEDMNTVGKIDAQLTCIEQNWAETQSRPFPEGIQNAIAKL